MKSNKGELISKDRELLQNPWAHVQGDGRLDAIVPTLRRPSEANLSASTDSIRGFPIRIRSRDDQFVYKKAEIEQIAKRMQISIWRQRGKLWPQGEPEDYVDLLDPAVALKLIGYDYLLQGSLGQFNVSGKQIDVAGLIDTRSQKVQISSLYPPSVRQFTCAHELGHAILHPASGLHRDRPLDGAAVAGARNAVETEADQFAAYFLMPKNLVEERFKAQFLTSHFTPTPERAYALAMGSSFTTKCKNLRDLSRILAAAEYFNDKNVNSLADQFHVSPEAMAIRLEDLKLVGM